MVLEESFRNRNLEEDRQDALSHSISMLNWRVERINGRNITTLVVLFEPAGARPVSAHEADAFVPLSEPQIRVLRLVPGEPAADSKKQPYACVVELWQREEKSKRTKQHEWKLVQTRTPLRLGKPLPLIPFVFHGPRHSQPDVEKLPLTDTMNVELRRSRYLRMVGSDAPSERASSEPFHNCAW